MQTYDFSGYRQFTARLRRLAYDASWDVNRTNEVTALLDGSAGMELRRLVELPTRRAIGAFFTGSQLAEKLLGKLILHPSEHFVYDPTVGAGDLLLAAARRLPQKRALANTLATWGQCLAGTDLQAEFVEAAKLRIALLARQLHGGREALPDAWRSLLPYIKRGDGFKQNDLFARATHVLMNPPYSLTISDEYCTWAGGRISEAALFVVRTLELVRPKTRIFAILPEVLRSGSFSEKWRKQVNHLAEVQLVQPYGIFDDCTDVDVFLLRLTCRAETQTLTPPVWTTTSKPRTATVADFFDVHVGRVVPHRDEESGPRRRYIHPRNIATWVEVTRISEKRRHKGPAYQPPFVVLRRTSRPGHLYRAAATVILGKKPVAVENHLIVCKARDKSVDTCRALMAQLRSQRVNDFLNQRIRCRHLTVGAVAAIPFEST